MTPSQEYPSNLGPPHFLDSCFPDSYFPDNVCASVQGYGPKDTLEKKENLQGLSGDISQAISIQPPNSQNTVQSSQERLTILSLPPEILARVSEHLTIAQLKPFLDVIPHQIPNFLASRESLAETIIRNFSPNFSKRLPENLFQNMWKYGGTIKRLNLWDIQLVSEDMLKIVEMYPRLQNIILPDCATDEFCLSLEKLKELQYLDMSGCKGITGDQFDILPKTIEKLNCISCENIQGANLSKLCKKLLNVRELNLAFCPNLTIDCEFPKKIRYLSLFGCRSINEKNLAKAWKTCSDLYEVTISYCTQLNGSCFTTLPKKLRYLHLIGTDIRYATVKRAYERCSSLHVFS